MDGLCTNLIFLCIHVSKDVYICFCNCWNTPKGDSRAEIFAALDASFEYSHITFLIYIFSRWTDFQKIS
jgi:hypothetical protein